MKKNDERDLKTTRATNEQSIGEAELAAISGGRRLGPILVTPIIWKRPRR